MRVDDRRWDLRLKDGAIIQLPATGEEAALIRLDQLDQKARILELGFAGSTCAIRRWWRCGRVTQRRPSR